MDGMGWLAGVGEWPVILHCAGVGVFSFTMMIHLAAVCSVRTRAGMALSDIDHDAYLVHR